jgi:peptidoglycan/xylan/chitin deacetylase (PgdA/CDA1 family)
VREDVVAEQGFLNNPAPMYFENATYALGRLYGVKQDPEILKQYDNLFSTENAFCVVLMYHNIYKDKKINGYDTSEKDFLKHIEILKQYGFESITLEDLYDFVRFNKKIPQKSVIFTFDDGFKSVVDTSYILKSNGFSGTASLIVGYIGSSWEVDKSEIDELVNNNFEISLHSYKLHNIYPELLKKKDYKRMENDINASKKYFEDTFKTEPLAFTYPEGIFDSKIENILKQLGFKIGFGLYKKSFNKYGEDPLYISRIEISERTKYANPNRFEELIKEIVNRNN